MQLRLGWIGVCVHVYRSAPVSNAELACGRISEAISHSLVLTAAAAAAPLRPISLSTPRQFLRRGN